MNAARKQPHKEKGVGGFSTQPAEVKQTETGIRPIHWRWFGFLQLDFPRVGSSFIFLFLKTLSLLPSSTRKPPQTTEWQQQMRTRAHQRIVVDSLSLSSFKLRSENFLEMLVYFKERLILGSPVADSTRSFDWIAKVYSALHVLPRWQAERRWNMGRGSMWAPHSQQGGAEIQPCINSILSRRKEGFKKQQAGKWSLWPQGMGWKEGSPVPCTAPGCLAPSRGAAPQMFPGRAVAVRAWRLVRVPAAGIPRAGAASGGQPGAGGWEVYWGWGGLVLQCGCGSQGGAQSSARCCAQAGQFTPPPAFCEMQVAPICLLHRALCYCLIKTKKIEGFKDFTLLPWSARVSPRTSVNVSSLVVQ